jgi:hypothetical protein
MALACGHARAENPKVASVEKDGCARNLAVIRQAIQGYWIDHKAVPTRLQNLVPQYIHDANALVCPVCKRTGQIESAAIPCSYVYDPRETNIVRCRHHDVVLNLATDGRIFESPAVWENLLGKQAIMDEFQPKRPLAAAKPALPKPVVQAQAKAPILPWITAIVGVGAVLFFVVKKFRRAAAPTSPQSNTQSILTIANLQTGKIFTSVSEPSAQAVPEEVRAGVIADLSNWLKRRFVQRLISDRQQLLATQEAARRKAQAVDDRLARLEYQIQQRNHEYEERIDALLKALVTAEEQNRELIRAQIAALKAEIEKNRLRNPAGESRQF